MDNLETPYEEDDGFIECTVCEKSLRGDTLYKIHLTTPGHLKVYITVYIWGKVTLDLSWFTIFTPAGDHACLIFSIHSSGFHLLDVGVMEVMPNVFYPTTILQRILVD
ncbi:hypothetical protein XENORESO_018956 [Xenotaenia resolanae]|uniref:C2H2-type domain-containing protein n=1 Tax=Xenotaenia resolanae TaxID=208358 RepID=A0ABV0WN81_9TELE